MPTKHVTQQIERYLDQQLSAEERQKVEEHLAICPLCMRRLFDARRLKYELGPVMQTALGRPTPPPALRQRVRQALAETQTSPRFRFDWAIPGRILNATATLAIIALLALAVFTIVRGQPPQTSVLPEASSLRPSNEALAQPITPSPNPLKPTPTPTPNLSSQGDRLPRPEGSVPAEKALAPLSDSGARGQLKQESPLSQEITDAAGPLQPSSEMHPPAGTIAFSFFNPAAHRQVYEVHLISPDGSNHRIFPLDGVSEPALSPTAAGLAYRAWSEPTSPRSLLTSNFEGERPDLVGGYWEDAQPDWSPTEARIIFASQRESDRRWRLYTAWEDGSAEKNLRREGRSPTFAPDGYRFAFESCDETGNRCGLWLADLDNSEYGSRPFLEDPLARSPDWSPVSEQIAYMANPAGNWDLFLVNSDGSQGRRLTTDPAIDGLPAWSPDGQWLAFLSNRGGNWGIWLLHVASGNVHRIFDFDGGTFTPPHRPPYGERNWWDEQLSWSY